MNSSMISKIEKARRYATELDRVKITGLQADFEGQHRTHKVEFKEGEWHCSCDFFARYGTCSHSMAMERILGEMIKDETESEPVLKVSAGGR
jgi:hypothetical protein